jgi:hypothetical protein
MTDDVWAVEELVRLESDGAKDDRDGALKRGEGAKRIRIAASSKLSPGVVASATLSRVPRNVMVA